MKPNQTITAYTKEFETLRRNMSFEESTKMTIGRYLNGLPQHIRHYVLSRRITSLSSCIAVAKERETQMEDEKKSRKDAFEIFGNTVDVSGKRKHSFVNYKGNKRRKFYNHNKNYKLNNRSRNNSKCNSINKFIPKNNSSAYFSCVESDSDQTHTFNKSHELNLKDWESILRDDSDEILVCLAQDCDFYKYQNKIFFKSLICHCKV